ncbi:MAG: heat shock protein HspQ [Rhodospirillaceae bacterium]
MSQSSAKFSLGQIVHHTLFDYRGVVTDLDPFFEGSSDWYDTMAWTNPPKDRPWYHVLVDGGEHRTYVAERNLEASATGTPIDHPDMRMMF